MQSGGCSIGCSILDGEKGGKVLFPDPTKLSSEQSGEDRAFWGVVEVYSIGSSAVPADPGEKTVENLGVAPPLGT